MPRHKPIIVGLGELLWDLLPAGRRLGGAPANFAYHANALGAEAGLVSAVGTDQLGADALAALTGAGLSTRFVSRDAGHPTGTVDVEFDGAGQPRYRIVGDVAWDFLADSPGLQELAATADAVCFGTLAQRTAASHQTIRRFLRHTTPQCWRILDINLRPPHFTPQVVHESLALVNVLKFNDEELPVLANMLGCGSGLEAVGDRVFSQYPVRLLALTQGAQGATLVTPHEQLHLPAVPPPIMVDTVGAGDAFAAAIAVGLVEGHTLREMGERAILRSSLACGSSGGMSVAPAAFAAGPACSKYPTLNCR